MKTTDISFNEKLWHMISVGTFSLWMLDLWKHQSNSILKNTHRIEVIWSRPSIGNRPFRFISIAIASQYFRSVVKIDPFSRMMSPLAPHMIEYCLIDCSIRNHVIQKPFTSAQCEDNFSKPMQQGPIVDVIKVNISFIGIHCQFHFWKLDSRIDIFSRRGHRLKEISENSV